MKKIGIALFCAVVLISGFALADDNGTEGEWSGEILDMACYISHSAKGADHADCAKRCVQGGQPMGLLTDDGKVLLLAADHKDGSAFEALKDLAGSQVEVTGVLTENAGMKMVTVTGGKAAG